jgi:predicted P-loop ATPase
LHLPDLTEKGMPRGTCENTRLAIQALGIECRHDTFHDRMLLGGHIIGQWAGELSDDACLVMRNMIRERFNFEPNAATMLDAARQVCLRNQFDPVCDYLNGLKWDGVERLGSWLIDYLGPSETEFAREVGRCVLIAAVRRARMPGTKFDQIVVLEGPEGRNKSTTIKVMAGEENFSDQSILTENDKTQQELLKGIWLYEIADLTGIYKADVDRVKAFASRTHDRARPAYGRVVFNQPRRCVLFATTNNDTYLQSQTGNRRFWPIKTGRINVDLLRADRDQLWAEAAAEEAAGASIILPEALWPTAAQEQAQRLHLDPWTDKLAGIVGEFIPDPDGLGYEERISSNRLFEHKLNIAAERTNWATFNRLKNVMVHLGWNGPEQMRIGRTKVRGYWRYVEKPSTDREPQTEGLVREVPDRG